MANGSFWSGVAYFPKSAISGGTSIPYKFYVQNSPFDGWESGIGNRTFTFPPNDTTLGWRFFNERNPLTSAEEPAQSVPQAFELYQNYPNPFNPETSIKYSIDRRSGITLSVFNVLGQLMRLLAAGTREAGIHSVVWNGLDDGGKPVGSGVYFIRLDADGNSRIRKSLLIR